MLTVRSGKEFWWQDKLLVCMTDIKLEEFFTFIKNLKQIFDFPKRVFIAERGMVDGFLIVFTYFN